MSSSGKDPIVGIDLGTSNSSVAAVDASGAPVVLADPLGRKIIPSVVSFHPNGNVLVGPEAKQRRIIDPRNTVYSVKRILGRRFTSAEVSASAGRSSFVIKEGPNEQPVVSTRAGEFAIPEVSAIILKHMRRIAEQALQTEVRRVVITVPANFNDAQRQATAAAGVIADLAVVRILNEPTAASLAYGHGRNLKQTVAVFDFGGGTFDISLLTLRDNVYEVLATAGDTFLGGDDIDARLVDDMVEGFLRDHRIDLRGDETAMQRLRAVAEQTKCELSTRPKALVKIEEIAIGPGGAALDLNFSLVREEFVSRVAHIIDRTLPVCDEVFRLAGISVTQIDEVVLVGGTTRIPYVREKVAGYFGRPPRVDTNPDEAVALGAALQGASLAVALDKPRGAKVPAVPPPPPGRAGKAPTPATPYSALPPAAQRQTLKEAPQTPPAIGRVQPKRIEKKVEKKPAVVEKQAPPGRRIDWFNAGSGETPDEPSVTDIQAIEFDTQYPTVPRYAVPERPVLLDVTPRGLGVATVSGYCDEIIPRNSQIPIEQTRVFTTAKPEQTSVEIKVCQGESRRFEENLQLGVLVLEQLPRRARGDARISVTFEIDTDGILQVSAHDEETGQKQAARIQILGAQSTTEIEAAKSRIRGLKEA